MNTPSRVSFICSPVDRINFKHGLFGLRQKCGALERRVESAADDRDQFLRRFGRHTPKLPDYRTPTLIVNGEHDNALSGGTRTAALIRHAVHKVLPGTGHCCFLEDPAGFNALVRDFLERNGLWPQG